MESGHVLICSLQVAHFWFEVLTTPFVPLCLSDVCLWEFFEPMMLYLPDVHPVDVADLIVRLVALHWCLLACCYWHTWRQKAVARSRAPKHLFRRAVPQRAPMAAVRREGEVPRAGCASDPGLWPTRPPGRWLAVPGQEERASMAFPARPPGVWCPGPQLVAPLYSSRPPGIWCMALPVCPPGVWLSGPGHAGPPGLEPPSGLAPHTTGASFLPGNDFVLPRLRRRAGQAIWETLLAEGGACSWLGRLRRERRRIGQRSLSAVWPSAMWIDATLLGKPGHTVRGRLRHDDGLELHFRGLASWWHLHQTGDVVAANQMLFNPAPLPGGFEIAPQWLLRIAKGKKREMRRRGLVVAPEEVRREGVGFWRTRPQEWHVGAALGAAVWPPWC